ncbi:Protein FAM171B [Collichthys lucidus]|uniref:Protein FAM171B n=1 Tax=Collichthys lucidus TaxID=240159 RepID=A0A4U5U1R3_COLLU|nr:Protein FAM171B [Collichthys lucidus]
MCQLTGSLWALSQKNYDGSAFNLKVQVNDVLHRKQLSKAVVEVYINYTRTNTALTGEDGSVLLHVPYQTGTPITIVAGKDGYIYTLLPCKTNRMPIFSSVTMSLLGLNQGNIWLFEDSVLITGKTSDASSQPIVQFPKSLLNLTDGGNVTSVKAYLTVPKLPSEESFLDTLGIVSTKSGFFGVAISTDFILRHSSFLMVILGGTLVIVICLLVGFLFYYRRPPRDSKIKKIPVMRKDQTTSTCDDEVFDVSSEDPSHPQDGLSQSFTERADNRHNASVISMNNGNIIANPNAVAITMECNELELNTDDDDLTNLTKQIRVPASLTDNLFFYNQPVAILHAPAFFHLEEQPEEPQWSKSATLPRAGASNSAATEPLSKDSFTQTLPKGPSATQNQPIETEDSEVLEGSQAATSTNTSRGHFTLPESVSVPGTLNKMGGSRHSVHALAELSKIPSLHPPRAWFVSLDGKPAAEIHYAVSEQHRRRRPVESRETSLDSGVDMSELNQTSVRRAVTLERNVTFVKSTSGSKHATPQ